MQVGNLNRIAAGERGKNLYKQLKGVPKSLRIYESPVKTFNDGPRFLWQVIDVMFIVGKVESSVDGLYAEVSH